MESYHLLRQRFLLSGEPGPHQQGKPDPEQQGRLPAAEEKFVLMYQL